jgi:hypothetical protein
MSMKQRLKPEQIPSDLLPFDDHIEEPDMADIEKYSETFLKRHLQNIVNGIIGVAKIAVGIIAAIGTYGSLAPIASRIIIDGIFDIVRSGYYMYTNQTITWTELAVGQIISVATLGFECR